MSIKNWNISPLYDPNPSPKHLQQKETSSKNLSHTPLNSIGRPASKISQHESEISSKTHHIFQSILFGLNKLVYPFARFAAFITNSFNQLSSKVEKTSLYILVLNKVKRAAGNELNVENDSKKILKSMLSVMKNYPGEVIINGPRVYEGTGLDTIKEQLQEIQQFDKWVKVEDPLSKEQIEVASGFFKDLPRVTYKLNGNLLYHADKFKKCSDPKAAAIFDACKQLTNRFGKQGAAYISSLVHQGLLADSIIHVRELFPDIPSNTRPYDITYEIIERGDILHLLVTNITAIGGGTESLEEVGYIGIQREIELSKTDLEKDWSQSKTNLEFETQITDRYTKFYMTKAEVYASYTT